MTERVAIKWQSWYNQVYDFPAGKAGGEWPKERGKTMARKVIQTLVDSTGPQRTPLADIPNDVIEFVETTYAKQRKNPGRERVEYGTESELKADYKLMTDYCAQRPAAKGGILAIRRSPTRDLPDNVMDIRITADLPENGKTNGGNGANATQKQTAAAK